jgi:hypothetical protein
MKKRYVRAAVVVAAVLTIGSLVSPRLIVRAQEKSAAEQLRALVPLRATVVITRLQGEKKLSNLPFTLTMNTTQRTNLRMGAEVPIPRTMVKEGTAVAGIEYRRVGTMIDCAAGQLLDDGRVALSITIDDSHMSIDNSAEAGSMRGLPRFHSFTSTATLVLRDGQTMQYTAATDKVSGEVVRVEVTLNVVK